MGRAGADGMKALSELSKGISGSRASTLAIVGGTLIDGTGAAPVPDAAVVIHNGRIVAAGPRSKVKIPKHANVVDAHGKTILPGLWDMHAHFEQVEWGPIYLAAGVTTVRDCGNEFEFITAVRDAIAQGRGLGPRLLLAGIVDGTGTYTIGVERVDTPEQARDVDRPLPRRRLPADEDLQLGQTRRTEDRRRRSPSSRHDRHRPRPRRIERLSGDRSGSGPDQPHRLHRRHHEGAAAGRTPRRLDGCKADGEHRS